MKDKVLQQKKAVIDEIKENIKNAKSMVMVDYRGLNVEELNELRTKFRNEQVLYKVYKNTMMDFAFKELGYDQFLEHLNGPNAVAFSMEDPIAGPRISDEFSKAHENLKIKAGYLGQDFLSKERVGKIASIPPKEVLIARLLGSFKSPLTNLAYLLSAIKDKKQELEGAAPAAEEVQEAVEQNTEVAEEQATEDAE